MPFWGACCINGKWYSNELKDLELGSLVDTPSLVVHEGSITRLSDLLTALGVMTVTSSPMLMLNTNYQLTRDFSAFGSNINLTRTTFSADSACLALLGLH